MTNRLGLSERLSAAKKQYSDAMLADDDFWAWVQKLAPEGVVFDRGDGELKCEPWQKAVDDSPDKSQIGVCVSYGFESTDNDGVLSVKFAQFVYAKFGTLDSRHDVLTVHAEPRFADAVGGENSVVAQRLTDLVKLHYGQTQEITEQFRKDELCVDESGLMELRTVVERTACAKT